MLKELLSEFQADYENLFSSPVVFTNKNQLTDSSKSWVIYQVGFDDKIEERLLFIEKLLNKLPELFSEMSAENEFDIENADKINNQIKKLVNAAIFDHEIKKHSAIS
jgi:hypothetical protein